MDCGKDLLDSAIFSQWRYVTHWSETGLLKLEYRAWFITAQIRTEKHIILGVHSVKILKLTELLVDKKYTCLPSVAAMIKSGTRIEEKVVAHGNIITLT